MIPMTHDYVTMIVLPQTVRLALGVLTVVVEKGLVRSEVAHRIRGNSPSFVHFHLMWVDFSWSPEQNLSSLDIIHS